MRQGTLAEDIKAIKLSLALNKSLVYSQLGDWDRSRGSAEEAKLIDSTSTKALFRLGVALRSLGRYDESKATLRRAVELDPKDKCVRNLT